MSTPGFLPDSFLNNGQEDHAAKVRFADDSADGAKTLCQAAL
jgi:hypothetical protein